MPILTAITKQEPVVQIEIEGERVPMLVDTRVTYTFIGLKDASHLPMSDKSVKTVGFSGKLQTPDLKKFGTAV